jgi:hypothetical protein
MDQGKISKVEYYRILEMLKEILEQYRQNDHDFYLKTLGEFEKMLRQRLDE